MVDLPDGVVTFLFTDVEGSTRLWGGSTGHDDGAVRLHDEAIESALEKHDGISVKFIVWRLAELGGLESLQPTSPITRFTDQLIHYLLCVMDSLVEAYDAQCDHGFRPLLGI